MAGNGLGEGAVWRGRRGEALGLMSFLLLRPVGASGGGDPFCRCAGRREGAAAGRSLCRRCSGGAGLGPCRRGLSGLVRAPLSAAPSPLHGGGVEGSGLFWRLGSPPGFPGIFALLSRGRFARRGETGADALLAGGMMGSLALSLAGCAALLPGGRVFGRRGGGAGRALGRLCAGGQALCRQGEKGLAGMEGESAAPARPRRGARRLGGGCRRRLGGGRFAPTARRRGGRRIAYGKRGGGLL